MKSVCALLILALHLLPATGQAPPQNPVSRMPEPRLTPSQDRLARVVRALDLESHLEGIRLAHTEIFRQQQVTVLEQLARSGLPEEALKTVRQRLDQAVQRIAQAWDVREAARIYAKGLSEGLSDSDLEEAARYYESPSGNRTHQAIHRAQSQMVAYIESRNNAAVQEEMRILAESLRAPSPGAR